MVDFQGSAVICQPLCRGFRWSSNIRWASCDMDQGGFRAETESPFPPRRGKNKKNDFAVRSQTPKNDVKKKFPKNQKSIFVPNVFLLYVPEPGCFWNRRQSLPLGQIWGGRATKKIVPTQTRGGNREQKIPGNLGLSQLRPDFEQLYRHCKANQVHSANISVFPIPK